MIYEIEDLIKKYESNFKDKEIDNNIMNDIIDSLLDYYECKNMDYKEAVKNIYFSICMIKYYSEKNNGDIGLIYRVIKYSSWMKYQHEHANYTDEYIKEISNKVYNELRSENHKLPKNMEEEFDIIHLYDTKYYLEKFKIWCNEDLEFVRIINNQEESLIW